MYKKIFTLSKISIYSNSINQIIKNSLVGITKFVILDNDPEFYFHGSINTLTASPLKYELKAASASAILKSCIIS